MAPAPVIKDYTLLFNNKLCVSAVKAFYMDETVTLSFISPLRVRDEGKESRLLARRPS
jgi:hypothetical protein